VILLRIAPPGELALPGPFERPSGELPSGLPLNRPAYPPSGLAEQLDVPGNVQGPRLVFPCPPPCRSLSRHAPGQCTEPDGDIPKPHMHAGFPHSK